MKFTKSNIEEKVIDQLIANLDQINNSAKIFDV